MAEPVGFAAGDWLYWGHIYESAQSGRLRMETLFESTKRI